MWHLLVVAVVVALLWAISPWSVLGAAIVFFGVVAFALSSRAPDWLRHWFTGAGSHRADPPQRIYGF